MPRKAVVVGAGPVGCLAALSLAKMGWIVEIYEARPDIRLPSSQASLARRSINLAISARGIAALQAVDSDMASRFLETVIPMKGRYLHDERGRESVQLYDSTGQCINSIDRGLLNKGLLDKVSSTENISVLFEHKLATADFDARVLKFESGRGDHMRIVQVPFDFCVGADGSYSNVRRQLMRVIRMDFHQEYIPHDYLELHIPATFDAAGTPQYRIDPNYLHIWPRHSFMLIALPNKDKTFTCTLFAPTQDLDKLSDRTAVLEWFRIQFPDIIPLVGEERLWDDFSRNPRSSLICIKAKPYHYKDRVLILGDAAHSMVPFYGQGLNCGFEDVRVLETLIREEKVDSQMLPAGVAVDDRLAKALDRYSATRHPDLVAICDLAMDNYVEMRHSVVTPLYRIRKRLDEFLSAFTPHRPSEETKEQLARTAFPSPSAGGWLSLYAMVTFRPDLSYATARRQAQWQTRTLNTSGWVAAVCGILGVGMFAVRSGLFVTRR
ncbi:FAD/NAD(P)-binding domain-containing protein [Sistotremastrum suecicum HHB10207 ss-3]|uniref:Kynurenine 3-monooxygenase n=1 Tax=Sistotremastrum suecicum HHB10207 ss-3 TaxID=1314776 RepID=A0A166ITG3_9AGAM|nr:FAD/NAD(P)-binding domain-containing protein [Sistotremastrum suecicum HHB10207 ss-3]